MNRAPVFAFSPDGHEREQLGLHFERADNALIVRLSSPRGAVRLTETNLGPLHKQVRDAMISGVNWLILDVRECLDIHSKAMGVLLSMRNALDRRGGGVTIVAADAFVRALFDAYEIADRFRFWPQLPSETHTEVAP